MEISELFENRTLNVEKLKNYGFSERGNFFEYKTFLPSSGFSMKINLGDGKISARVFDEAAGEEYTLHLVGSANGEFVGKVRAEYLGILGDIAEKCFDIDVFRTAVMKQILSYAQKTYGDLPEFLWEKLPDAAVLRRKDTKKWYLVLMKVPYSKFGLEREGLADVIDLRADKQKLEALLERRGYFPAYHMNKKSWITIFCDGTAGADEIIPLIDISYSLAK